MTGRADLLTQGEQTATDEQYAPPPSLRPVNNTSKIVPSMDAPGRTEHAAQDGVPSSGGSS
jgi:hypothetical protein